MHWTCGCRSEQEADCILGHSKYYERGRETWLFFTESSWTKLFLLKHSDFILSTMCICVLVQLTKKCTGLGSECGRLRFCLSRCKCSKQSFWKSSPWKKCSKRSVFSYLKMLFMLSMCTKGQNTHRKKKLGHNNYLPTFYLLLPAVCVDRA